MRSAYFGLLMDGSLIVHPAVMQIEEIPGPTSAPTLTVISGLGAGRILARQSGLHVLEYSGAKEQSARAVARVRLSHTPDHVPDAGAPRQAT